MEKKQIVIQNPLIFSGYSHIGSCRAFIWSPREEGEKFKFEFRDLCYSDSIETLSFRQDLYLCTGTGEEFLVQGFELTEVISMREIHGLAEDISPLNRSFPEVKAASPNMEGMLSQRTQLKAIRTVSSMVNIVRSKQRIQTQETREAAGMIIGEIAASPDAIINLMAVKSFDDYTYAHSINVATLALTIGHYMKLPKADLLILGMGALLHDIGRLRINLEILNKEGKLTENEFKRVRQYPQIGYELLKSSVDLDPRVLQTVLYHHEKFHGGGYPRGLKGKDIHLFARIVAIAEVYDALTSPRPYRPAMNPYDAIRVLLSNTENQFDPEILAVFVKRMSLFPPGSMVKLSDGSEALVIRPNPGGTFARLLGLSGTHMGKGPIRPKIWISAKQTTYMWWVLELDD